MILNKKLAVAVSGAVLLMAGQIALADSTTDIVDALISKGVLTEEEGKLISKGAKAKADATPTVKEKDGAFILSSPNGKNSIQLTGRLHFDAKYNDINSNDFLADNLNFASADGNSGSMASHFNARRARLGVKGRLGGVADYELVGNFAGTPGIDVAYLDINKYEPLGFTFGRFKVAPNLEIKTSSNNIDMIERSYVSQNTPEKKFGAAIHGEFTGLTYFGSAFQNNDTALSQRDSNLSTAGRATANFGELMGNKDVVFHVGLNGYSSNYQVQPTTSGNTSDDASADARATVFGFNSGGQGVSPLYRGQIGATSLLNTLAANTSTGAITGTNNLGYNVASPNTANVKANNYGLEGIAAYNNFKLQGEYAQTRYDAAMTGSTTSATMGADVETWYAEALWMVTGEKYADAYKKGAFGALKPKSEFNLESGTGAGLIELGFRLDSFDVTDTFATGKSRFQGATQNVTTGSSSNYGECTASSGAGCTGGAKSYTASVKWIWTPNLLWKLNYTHTSFDNPLYPIDILGKADTVNNQGASGSTRQTAGNIKSFDSENLLMLRGQWMF